MISYIKGTIHHIFENSLLVVTNDIGYKVYVTSEILSSVTTGSVLELYTYQNVKEDALDLFGFPTLEELHMFELLISISGVGPKSGLGVLSSASVYDLESAIVRGDSTVLTKVSGIGKKTAERIVLELKGKIGDVSMVSGVTSVPSSDVEVISALEGLGYSTQDARQALQVIDATLQTTDEKLKAALQALARK